MKMKYFFAHRAARTLLSFCIITASGLMAACDDDDDGATPAQNVVTLASGNSNLSTLVAALTKYPDLVSTLGSTGSVTVFAPTNTAFENILTAIGQSSIDDIPEDVLKTILQYHVVGSEVKSTQLTNGPVETVQGEDITVSLSSGVKLNGNVNVTQADIDASNGVVHVVDAVLVPPSVLPIVGTIVAPAYFNKNFTTLIAAVKGASPTVLETLLNASKKTLFAPTNAAFEAAGITTLPAVDVLNTVLTYHVLSGEVFADDIAAGSSSATSVQGSKLYLSKGSAGVFINGTTKVTATDIEGSNGVVHVIDRTILPPAKTIAAIVSDNANAATNKQFTKLLAAVARTSGQGANDLLAAISNPGDLTVFAPTDAAFEALFTLLGVSSVDDIPLSTLIAVLKHHVVAAKRFSSDLSTGSLATLNGNLAVDLGQNPPTVTGSSGGGNVANLQVSLLNIHATNGVIHVVDKVLLPE
jgi:transforming growth factor-beta-induced protein